MEPGATIGATISSISSMHSMMQGLQAAYAFVNAALKSARLLTRVPSRPYASASLMKSGPRSSVVWL